MREYLDQTFWKEASGFTLIVLVIVALILALGYYNSTTYGGDGQELIDQQAGEIE